VQSPYGNQSQPADSAPSHSNYAEPQASGPSSLQAGMLNELLRKQLTPDLPSTKIDTQAVTITQTQANNQAPPLTQAHVDLVEQLLEADTFERATVHQLLSDVFHLQQDLYQQLDMPDAWRKQQFIGPNGLVMSPDNCLTSMLDDIRVRSFIRGIDAAIKDKVAKQANTAQPKPIHVVYPACGPFAPLLLPLLAYYRHHSTVDARQLQVTLIDIQPGAVANLAALVEQLEIDKYIAQINCQDVTEYQDEAESIDLLVLEAMQHGFSREGHMTFARHLAQFMPLSGEILPQEITIHAQVVDANVEYVNQWQGAKQVSFADTKSDALNQRIDLGEVVKINAQTLGSINQINLDENTSLLECNTLEIPSLPEDHEPTVIFTTQIKVWGEQWIKEYDSGITHPLPDQNICINFTPTEDRPGDILLKTGDSVKFYYRLNGLPGFLPMCVDSAQHEG